jgi:asparagine synthase (glutamine-hydrolysing)
MGLKSKLSKCVSSFRLAAFSPKIIKNIYKVRKSGITYLSNEKLVNISECIKDIENNQIEGIFIEAGCALGGSSIIIASSKEKSRKLHIYDVFEQIPPPSSNDDEDAFERYKTISKGAAEGINEDIYYGYQENLLGKVINNFNKFDLPLTENNIDIHKGLFNDVLNITEPVAFAHIDSDWYDPIFTCLERIVPYLSPGGVIIIDDYYDWKGAKKATDEYFENIISKFQFEHNSHLIVRKLKV